MSLSLSAVLPNGLKCPFSFGIECSANQLFVSYLPAKWKPALHWLLRTFSLMCNTAGEWCSSAQTSQALTMRFPVFPKALLSIVLRILLDQGCFLKEMTGPTYTNLIQGGGAQKSSMKRRKGMGSIYSSPTVSLWMFYQALAHYRRLHPKWPGSSDT